MLKFIVSEQLIVQMLTVMPNEQFVFSNIIVRTSTFNEMIMTALY